MDYIIGDPPCHKYSFDFKILSDSMRISDVGIKAYSSSSGIYSIMSPGWQLRALHIFDIVLLSSPPVPFFRAVKVPCPINFSWRIL